MFTVLQLCEATSSFTPLSKSTKYGWRHSIRGFEDHPVVSIDRPFGVMHRVELLQRGYKQGYIRTRLGYLASMWETGIEMELAQSNPWRGLLKKLTPSRKKYPQKNFQHYSAFHNDPLFMGIWYHGFRISELANIKPKDFVLDVEIPYINIEHNEIRKCKNDYTQRHVPIHPSYFRFIDQFDFSVNPRAGDNFSRRLKDHTGVSAHGIRHSFITRMRQAGIEYSIAMKIVGHKPVGMTASYGEVLIEDMAAQLRRLR